MSNRLKICYRYGVGMLFALLLVIGASVPALAASPKQASPTMKPHHTGITPFYRLYNSQSNDHFYTTSPAERDYAIAHYGYRAEGIAAYIFSSQQANTVPFYRAFSPSIGDHFYTTNYNEYLNATNNLGYNGEGIAGYIFDNPVDGAVPFYRLYNGKVGDHFYTTSYEEKSQAIQLYGYREEGIAGYVFPAQ